MKYRTLAKTNQKVSEIGFGVWTVASPWWGVKDDETGIRLMRKALDLGINFFDTADNYGNGKGETLLRAALGERRDEIVIATKFGYDWYHNERKGQQELPQDFSPAYIRFSVEESLKRLGTDRIDLYQLHNPRIDTIRRDDTFETLEALRREGKVLHYGVALGPAIHERQAGEAVAAMKERGCASAFIIYNLMEQMLGPTTFAAAREAGASVLVRVPHASGVLEGNLTKDTTFDKNDHRSFRTKTAEDKRKWLDEGLRKVEKLAFLTRERTIAQAALRFVLAEPTITSVFPNIYGDDQLAEFAAASDTPDLTAEDLSKVDDLVKHDFYLEPVTTNS